MPTQLQAEKAIRICQSLSDMYQPINVFRYDEIIKTIYVQAGVDDSIALIIEEDGNLDFVA